MIEAVLFDLDGTLLPMNEKYFLKLYFGGLCAALRPHGYDPEELVANLWEGTRRMVGNDGTRSNEEVFWDYFRTVYGERVDRDMPLYDAFYRTDFDCILPACRPAPEDTAALVRGLRARGFLTVLATNPVFPRIATERRMGWAGVTPEDFAWVTTYEGIGYGKPNPDYYRAVAERLGVPPASCLMVGNHVVEDGEGAARAGMQVFLLTDDLIDPRGLGPDAYPHGDRQALRSYLNALPGPHRAE